MLTTDVYVDSSFFVIPVSVLLKVEEWDPNG